MSNYRACATCFYHDGATCHWLPHPEATNKFYWCKEWAPDRDKQCQERKVEKSITGHRSYDHEYGCALVRGHKGDHEFEFIGFARETR